jgi:aspartyl-tRNA(Asn)/glutamyl-tRNA(Gln) amidotransferase subunit A
MLTSLSLREAAVLLRTRKISPVELTQACLERIQQFDSRLHAFITLTAEQALDHARAAESEIAAGTWRGPLHGIPLALKDLIDAAGVRTTAASTLFQTRTPQHDAEVVRRLKSAGAVLLGKLNLHELAYGGSGVIGAFGVARNPWSLNHIAGGSSSGAASAVAAQLCFGALGTDTAGSVRMPAALCGIVGLKPSYGLVSTRGVLPLSWSLDHVGPMTRTVADSAVILQAIAGYDPGDLTSREFPLDDYESGLLLSVSGLRVGLATFSFADLHPDVGSVVSQAVNVIRNLGCQIQEVEVPVDSDRTVQAAEAYAVYSPMMEECSRQCDPQTVRRIQSGAEFTAAEYIQRKRELDRLRRQAERIFSAVDLLLSPTAPLPAFTIAELESDLAQLRARELQLLRNTRPFNVLGIPAVSIPCGFTESGLPVGLQVVGPAGAESSVLCLAHAYEQATEWHKRMPSLESGKNGS